MKFDNTPKTQLPRIAPILKHDPIHEISVKDRVLCSGECSDCNFGKFGLSHPAMKILKLKSPTDVMYKLKSLTNCSTMTHTNNICYKNLKENRNTLNKLNFVYGTRYVSYLGHLAIHSSSRQQHAHRMT